MCNFCKITAVEVETDVQEHSTKNVFFEYQVLNPCGLEKKL